MLRIRLAQANHRAGQCAPGLQGAEPARRHDHGRHDHDQVHKLLHAEEGTVCGNTEAAPARTRARSCRTLMPGLPGCRKAFEGAGDEERTRAPLRGGWEQHKASVRAKVEHPFRMIKLQFGCAEMRYLGETKAARSRMRRRCWRCSRCRISGRRADVRSAHVPTTPDQRVLSGARSGRGTKRTPSTAGVARRRRGLRPLRPIGHVPTR